MSVQRYFFCDDGHEPEQVSMVGEYYVTAKDYDHLLKFTQTFAWWIFERREWLEQFGDRSRCHPCGQMGDSELSIDHGESCIVGQAQKWLRDNPKKVNP